MESKRDLLKGSSNSLLLCLLDGQPMYGYQIVKELEAKSQGYFKFKEGTLYPALHRLEKSALISSKWELLSNGRQRRYYTITDKGRATLAREKTQWLDFFNAITMVLQPQKTSI